MRPDAQAWRALQRTSLCAVCCVLLAAACKATSPDALLLRAAVEAEVHAVAALVTVRTPTRGD